MIPVTSAVPAVGATFGHHLHFSASGARELSTRVVRCNAKLFQAFYRGRNNRPRSGHETCVISSATLHVAGRVASVNHVRILVGTGSRYGSATEIAFAGSSSAVKAWDRHRLKQQQGCCIAA